MSYVHRFVQLVFVLFVALVPLFPANAADTSQVVGPSRPSRLPMANMDVANTVTVPDSLVLIDNRNLNLGRYSFSITQLLDGTLLLAGGGFGLGAEIPVPSASIYAPSTGVKRRVGDMLYGGGFNYLTLLEDGRFLVHGGNAECSGECPDTQVYNPATETFEPTPDVLPRPAIDLGDGTVLAYQDRTVQQCYPTSQTCAQAGQLSPENARVFAVRLANDDILIGGGDALAADVYTPSTGAVVGVGSTNGPMSRATLLLDGRVLVRGATSAELYDPATRAFTPVTTNGWRVDGPSYRDPRGKVFIYTHSTSASFVVFDPATDLFTAGTGVGFNFSDPLYGGYLRVHASGYIVYISNDYRSGNPTYRGRFVPTNAFTGTLTLPEGWLNATTPITVRGTTSDAALNAAAINGGAWMPLTSGEVVTTMRPSGAEGLNRPIVLRLRDTNTLTAAVVTTTADLDFTAPQSTMTALPTSSRVPFTLNWSGSDALSGVAGYDVEVRDGDNGTWKPVVSNTKALSTRFTGLVGHTYFFRVRARDIAGNVEAWPVTFDTKTTIIPPASQMNALPATSRATFTLRWRGISDTRGIANYDVEVRDGVYGAWKPVVSRTTALSTSFTGVQRHTYFFRVRARDVAGNVEAWPETFDTKTQVDTVAPIGSLRINNGAAATTSRTVYLALNARDAQSPVTKMRIAQAGTSGTWLPYAASSTLTLAGTDGVKQVTVQFQDSVGNISQAIIQSIRLDTAAGTESSLSINNGAAWTNTAVVTLRIGAAAGTTELQISNDGGFANAVWQPFNSRPTWKISTDGGYSVPRTVYVRTRDHTGQTRPFVSDDIIYDPQRPTGSVAITTVQPSSVAVRLQAQDPDNISGVK